MGTTPSFKRRNSIASLTTATGEVWELDSTGSVWSFVGSGSSCPIMANHMAGYLQCERVKAEQEARKVSA